MPRIRLRLDHHLHRQRQSELAAKLRRRLHSQLSTHEMRQLPTNRQAQSCAEIFTTIGIIDLDEGIKDAAELGLAHTDTRVTHLDAVAWCRLRRRISQQSDLDLTMIGKFNGIAQQVREHLHHFLGIAKYP